MRALWLSDWVIGDDVITTSSNYQRDILYWFDGGLMQNDSEQSLGLFALLPLQWHTVKWRAKGRINTSIAHNIYCEVAATARQLSQAVNSCYFYSGFLDQLVHSTIYLYFYILRSTNEFASQPEGISSQMSLISSRIKLTSPPTIHLEDL